MATPVTQVAIVPNRMMSDDLVDPARRLLEQQICDWPFLRERVEALSHARTRTIDFGGRFVVKPQFNPGRLPSVTTKMDEQTIRNRACFLCDANRPTEQRAVDCGGGFKLLCNPFPILPEHLTIVTDEHRPQRILDDL